MTISQAELIHITAVTRSTVLAFRDPNSCIASTRVLGGVLDYFGHTSEPVACTAVAFNPEGWELAQAGVPTDEWPQTAHSIGVAGSGTMLGENRWDGHLVAIVDDHWLVDPSLDQFSRPARNLEIAPVILDATKWTDRSQMAQWTRPDGLVLAYKAMPEQGPWRNAPDWRGHKKEFRDAIATVIREVKRTAA